MYEIRKTVEGQQLISVDEITENCWINVVDPDIREINILSKMLDVEPDFIHAALDTEERARFEIDDDTGSMLILVGFPYAEFERDSRIYETMPLGIIVTEQAIVTVCSNDSLALQGFLNNKVKTFTTNKPARFLLQILFKVAALYIEYLTQINKSSEHIQDDLASKPENKEILQLLDLQKSLVYFSNALRANQLVFEKLKRQKIVMEYEEDFDLIEDILIENNQAMEMTKIYGNILSNIMNAYASIMSNNLSYVMKYLTSVTILLCIPTIVSGFFGMNVPVPFDGTEYAFLLIVIITLLIILITTLIMSRKKLF